jgi:carboxyl-terminal processing protease
VKLLVIRTNAADPHEVTLTREAPGGPPVAVRRLDSNVVLARVRSFGPETAEGLRSHLTSLQTTAATPVLIDLRGVADGSPDDAIAAARLFVKYGPLATSVGRDEKQAVTAPESGDGAFAMPLVVLVSNGTAHAAEIFAAALQGNKRAKLVGEPTSGLAGEQKLFRLPAGHGLWMTYRRYLTVAGRPIHGQGLEPDVPVAAPVTEFGETPPATDAVLERALDVARSTR